MPAGSEPNGFKLSYREMLEKAGFTTRCAQRIELCNTFAQMAFGFSCWFPEKIRGCAGGRNEEVYQEFQSRTGRLYSTHLCIIFNDGLMGRQERNTASKIGNIATDLLILRLVSTCLISCFLTLFVFVLAMFFT